MEVVSGRVRLKECENIIAVMGVFDGVHKGHQALIQKAKILREGSEKLAAVTFNPHPLQILRPQCKIKLLSTTLERRQLLAEQGIDILYELPFTEELASRTPCSFIAWLTALLDIKHVVVGYNFRFGRHAAGDTLKLQELGRSSGFEVSVVPPVQTTSGEVISSTLIRSLLKNGDICAANGMLGRPYSMQGPVVKGFGRGRKLGFPTANIQVSSNKLVPADGVYAAQAVVNGTRYWAVVNIGANPTFGNKLRSVEAHLLDFSLGDLYGSSLTLDFLKFIREERAFASVQELRRQVEQDIEYVRNLIQCRVYRDCAFTAGS